tara:strand:- start:460 stop:657 length:198 start_codon:yes stop_codon:yes gene_type:complete
MTPKEKAKELVNKFLQVYDGRVPQAKKCTLICIDEFIDALSFNSSPTAEGLTEFYTEVKIEINKL